MRNFLKTKLNYGIEPYIKSAIENQTNFSFSLHNLPKRPDGEPLNRQELEFVDRAPTGKTQMRPTDYANPNALTAEKLQKINANQVNINSHVERVINGNPVPSGTVTYDLNGMRTNNSNQHSLDNRFKLLEQTKKLKKINEGLENGNDDIDMEFEQENINLKNLNSDQVQEAMKKQDLMVFSRWNNEERQITHDETDKGYFALLASEMLEIADKYKRDVEEVHKIFFEVSCQKDKLIKILEG
jgi:seryl-tRNA synthetase